MKINSLRFKNINSLQGQWKIDFTLTPFSDNGLFDFQLVNLWWLNSRKIPSPLTSSAKTLSEVP